MISLPEDLFYPTAAPTTIIIAKAHVPMKATDDVLMGRVWNDGFEKLKNMRVEREGSQLPEALECIKGFLNGEEIKSDIFTTISGNTLLDGSEWSPQQWLPQPEIADKEMQGIQELSVRSIFQAVARIPELADEVLEDFTVTYEDFPELPLGKNKTVSFFFDVKNGQSSGEKNYDEGTCPYISSGDQSNSIVRPVAPIIDEVYETGGITVTAFGQAAIQPWPFMARGNGGSSVRVLIPKYKMSFRELAWFCAQINAQRWRFFYARMSIKSRLQRLCLMKECKKYRKR